MSAVTARPSSVTPDDRILRVLRDSPHALTLLELVAELRLELLTVRRVLIRLKRNGKVESVLILTAKRGLEQGWMAFSR